MANEKNLIPNSKRTPSELREMAQKGGRASGVARGFKAVWKQMMKENPDGVREMIEAMQKEAVNGNVKAFLAIVDLNGESVQRELAKLKAKELKLKEKAMSQEPEDVADDGFIEALNGTAAEDWSGDDE